MGMHDNLEWQWCQGVAGATRYPTDGEGGADASSAVGTFLAGSRAVAFGIDYDVIDTTNTVQIVDGAGNVLFTHTPTSTAKAGSQYPCYGWLHRHATDANIGIKCNGTNAAKLSFRKIA